MLLVKKIQNHRIIKWLPLVAIFLAFFTYWYYFAFSHPVEIWTLAEDPPIMGFAEAVNIDFWFRTSGARALSQAQFYQPGLPFQFASWILYRLAYLGQTTNPIELFKFSIQNLAPFWMSTQIGALLLSFLSCYLIWRRAIPYGVMTAIAATLVFYSSIHAWHYGFIVLFNESFSLLFAIIYFFTALSFLRAKEPHRWTWLIASGVAAGFLYLHKMNYVVWGIALLPAIFAEAALTPKTFGKSIRYAAVYLLTLVTTILIFGSILLGWSGFKLMIKSHKEIFLSSGTYGNGPKTIVNLSTMIANTTSLLTTEKSLFLLAGLFLLLGFVYLIINLRHHEWLKNNLSELVLLATATVMMTLALIKHYQPYYTVSIAAILPFWILWLARNRYRMWIYISIPIILIGIYLGTTQNFAARAQDLLDQTEIQADEREVLAMPMKPGQIRLWVYRYRGPIFARLFLLNFSGLGKLQKEINEIQGSQYLASPWHTAIEFDHGYTDIKNTPWRYFVLEKTLVDTYLNWNVYSWLKSPTIKRTELRHTVIYENLNPKKNGAV